MRKFKFPFFNKKLLQPLALNLIFKDFLKLKNRVFSNEFHLKAAIDWIIFAQKITKDGGVSKCYSLISGWLFSYPETSGYILPTLFDYYNLTKNEFFLEICKKIADWECSIQLKNGGFQGGVIEENNPPKIFATSQVLLGLIRAYKILKEEKYIECAIKAGDFILHNQESNGSWYKYCFKHSPETYNVRTAWALLELSQITGKENYKLGTIKNMNWALKQKNENYWFDNNDPTDIKTPFLHFISYTIRGFLEIGILLDDDSLKQISFIASSKLLSHFENKGWLPARFNSKWKSNDSFSCLSGNAQLSIIWLKLYQLYKEKKFLINAIKLNNYLKSTQIINKTNIDVNGAIKGSDPIWGKYAPYRFPNWATKFFCDALILQENILKNL